MQFAKLTRAEHDTTERIAHRFIAMRHNILASGGAGDADPIKPIDVMMDLAAVSAHTPLDLAGLLEADDFEFAHDVGGIRRHLDRSTGELTGCFVPRHARRETVTERIG